MGATKKVRTVSIALEDPEICEEPLVMKKIFSETDEEAEPLEQQDGGVPLPPDGGWGWVVCLASFVCNLVLDGIAYTFGVLLTPLVKDFESDRATVSWVGSLLAGMYMLSGSVVGGLVNRFGNRPVCISGAILAWAAISLSTLSVNVPMLMITYGVIGGFGLGLIYLPAVVAVGHYFESKRALATGIAVCGSGVGTFLFAPLSSYLVQNYDWKTSNLIFGSFFAVCILCGAVMKPLEVSVPDEKKIERLVLELPDGRIEDLDNPTYNGLRNVRTMPSICEDPNAPGSGLDPDSKDPKADPESKVPRRKLSINNNKFPRNYSAVQIKTLRPRMGEAMSVVSMSSMKTSSSSNKLAVPFHRKDIFYSGSLTNFDIDGEVVVRPNRSSFLSVKDGGERFMSRSSLVNPQIQEEEEEKVTSVLRSMMDTSLLKQPKFIMVSVSNIFGFLGFYVPFMYLPSLVQTNKDISGDEAAMVLSVIGISNTLGRILTGWLADRPGVSSLSLTSLSLLLSALCVFIFPFIPNLPLFIVLAAVFGLFVAAYISLTSILLVDLFGIDSLTSSFGLVTMCRGGAAILGPPLAGAIFEATDSFVYSFLAAGSFFLAAAICSFTALCLHNRDLKKAAF